MRGKHGISAIVAVVLTILITVAAIIILWNTVVPMVRIELVFQGAGQVSVVVSEGYTFCDPDQEVVFIQVKQAAADVNVDRIKLILSYKGKIYSQIEDAPGPNNMRTYPFVVSGYECDFDYVSVVPIINGIEGSMAGKKDVPLGKGDIVSIIYESCWDAVTSPHPICTCDDLQNVNTQLTWDYVLSNNVDCSDTTNWNGGLGFEPIGDYWLEPFAGVFDGQGFEISDLFVNRSSDGSALFEYIEDGSINNLGLVGANIIGDALVGGFVGSVYVGNISNSYIYGDVTGDSYYTGGFVGDLEDGFITDSYFSGNVFGEDEVGGFVGTARDVEIKGSYFLGSVNATASYVGGLIGISRGLLIEDSYSIASINGLHRVGGLVGDAVYGTIVRDSYSTGDVFGADIIGGLIGYFGGGESNGSYSAATISGVNAVGGLVGLNGNGVVVNSYSSGDVSGSTEIGGLVGRNEENINKSYSVGRITNSTASYIGGFVGRCNDPDISDSYWDTQTSGLSIDSCASSVGKITSDMKKEATFSGWDFDDVWGIDEDVSYPCLLWEDGCS